ncbi:hypothetical protein PP182_03610 [Maribacter sp. PR1]|uniref:TonB-dependent receptor plug domain-containing protein n=1 Tax=Maribacter cobaltidurans TaxID=1178778 RepID=A0ABU7IQA8_9FLAO|nr:MULTISPECIES: hypothetical protein [Maribacter]MDC6387752.1 hypothetical protein [Maribacter sp. PR1]MEE1975141.1 hypothetical protein [Maribacter cobaltidurans]
MKKLPLITLIVISIFLYNCGTPKNTMENSSKTETIDRERTDISLLDRIRKKGGVIVRNGVPLINKAANSFSSEGSQEPLYVLNSQVIGNSFDSVNDLVDSFNVKSIRILSGSEASSYGTQGGKGVILITTFK